MSPLTENTIKFALFELIIYTFLVGIVNLFFDPEGASLAGIISIGLLTTSTKKPMET